MPAYLNIQVMQEPCMWALGRLDIPDHLLVDGRILLPVTVLAYRFLEYSHNVRMPKGGLAQPTEPRLDVLREICLPMIKERPAAAPAA